jgi:hypothetical protein
VEGKVKVRGVGDRILRVGGTSVDTSSAKVKVSDCCMIRVTDYLWSWYRECGGRACWIRKEDERKKGVASVGCI